MRHTPAARARPHGARPHPSPCAGRYRLRPRPPPQRTQPGPRAAPGVRAPGRAGTRGQRRSRSNGRHAARHRLERHVAESLGEAREQEEIGGGEMLGEVLAETQAHEDEVGVLAREVARRLVPCRPRRIAHRRAAHGSCGRLRSRAQVLLRGDATEIDHREPAFRDSPAIAQFLRGGARDRTNASQRPGQRLAPAGTHAVPADPRSSGVGTTVAPEAL